MAMHGPRFRMADAIVGTTPRTGAYGAKGKPR